MKNKFNDLKFGIFVHWGLYSILEEGEWIMFRKNISSSEYRKLADKFNPKKLNIEKWVSLAKKAGAKYILFLDGHAEWCNEGKIVNEVGPNGFPFQVGY